MRQRLAALALLGIFVLFARPAAAQAPGRVTIANASSTGTTLNKLAKLTGAPSTAVISGGSDTSGAVGVSAARAVTNGFDLAFAVAAVFCAGGVAVAATKLRSRAAGDAVVTPVPERIEVDEGEALAA